MKNFALMIVRNKLEILIVRFLNKVFDKYMPNTQMYFDSYKLAKLIIGYVFFGERELKINDEEDLINLIETLAHEIFRKGFK